MHFELLLLEKPMKFLPGKRSELAQGQVGHGRPRVLHPFKSAKDLPGRPTK